MRASILFIAVASLVLAYPSSAQMRVAGGAWELGVDAIGGVPVGVFADSYKFGIGGTASLAYRIDPNFSLAVKSGYIRFLGEDITIGAVTSEGPDVDVVPILGSAKYYLISPGNTARPYVEADAGVYLMSVEGGDATISDFGVAPLVGSLFRISDNVDIDIHASYTAVFADNDTNQWIGFGGGLSFHGR